MYVYVCKVCICMYIDQVGLRLFRFCPIYVLGLNMISPRQRHTRFN